ncbi:multicopper oxidase domain-containing protein [Rhodococcus sp. D2-41]|uniref:Multicopper oxidase CueO n=1 Tax=Speluncibacter jeojiensis TaxID=2710754 RepID=A0A9X4LZY3_9ACTN|nr:multicopper oxidase domain-containing protein [Rhodococcus sp. D2-41]MDG3009736.1 multicopper oxidase domain-containing protein [Rhodococcus sp. D2-41]MDG3014485.1 multicopper oxidase domain-containing protein [Corynebacteriales bacterium D3-21]
MTVSRRRFLGWSAAGIGGAALLGAGIDWQLSGPRTLGKTLTSQARLPEPFTLPGTVPAVLAPYRSDQTADYHQVTQRRATATILPGYRTDIWGYNGQFPGPTLAARHGRTAVVTHRNELDVPTVVHVHGGHTPADSDGYPTDYLLPVAGTTAMLARDPQAVIARGQRDHTYPNDQLAATLWYHDHRMDFTGSSVWQGLAGFHLITDEPEQALPLPRGDRDLPLMLCDRAFDARGRLAYPAQDPTFLHTPGVTGDYMQGVQGDVILVNGVPWPRYDVAAARHRLRWLNASNARVYRLRLDTPHRQAPGFVQIGSDGGLLDKPQHLDAIDMAPSERFDTVVDLTGYRPGEQVTIVNDLGDGTTVPVLRLRVTHTVDDTSAVPDRLVDLERLDPAHAVRTREMNFRMGKMTAMDGSTQDKGWLINGKPFDPQRADATARLGDLEIWRITSDFNHPVHVHLNQFQVLSRNGRDPRPTDRGWKDTINLDAGQAAEIAVRFTDYTGRFLLHCHNLEHEDMAMMANLTTTL